MSRKISFLNEPVQYACICIIIRHIKNMHNTMQRLCNVYLGGHEMKQIVLFYKPCG